MADELNNIIDRLKSLIDDENLIDNTYELMEKLEEREDSFNSIELILELIEENPNTDFGQPGPLVHFMEKFYNKGYEEKLVKSLERKPTQHTLWMLNRIINASKGELKKYYLNVLEKAISSPNIDKDTLSTGRHFLELHI